MDQCDGRTRLEGRSAGVGVMSSPGLGLLHRRWLDGYSGAEESWELLCAAAHSARCARAASESRTFSNLHIDSHGELCVDHLFMHFNNGPEID